MDLLFAHIVIVLIDWHSKRTLFVNNPYSTIIDYIGQARTREKKYICKRITNYKCSNLGAPVIQIELKTIKFGDAVFFFKHTLTKYEWLLNWPAKAAGLPKGWHDPSLQQPTTPCKGPPVLCKYDSLYDVRPSVYPLVWHSFIEVSQTYGNKWYRKV